MTNTLPKLSARTDRPVEPRILDILRRVDAAARQQRIDYFVGGALARDLILLHVFGKDTGRAMRDVDLGICIDDWARLDSLKGMLIQGGVLRSYEYHCCVPVCPEKAGSEYE